MVAMALNRIIHGCMRGLLAAAALHHDVDTLKLKSTRCRVLLLLLPAPLQCR